MENNNNQNNRPSNTSENGSQKRTSRRKTKKRHTATSVLSYIAFILLTSAVISFFAIIFANDMFAFMKEDEIINVTLPEDASVGEVASALADEGVISYGFLYNIFTTLTSDDPSFAPGTHELNSSMDYRAITSALRLTTADKNVVTVTIPEGYTISQIVDDLVNKKVASREDLMATLNDYNFKHEFIDDIPDIDNHLEGYLFPDTYEFYEGDESVQVINKMLNNFNSKYNEEIVASAEALGLTMHEVITIASLIEREAKKDEERATISGVIHNRLENSSNYPYLQIDATIQYAVGHNNPLTKAELEIDSPYNTYTNKGLPPGPIASPGYASIYAAVNPENHDYYFYVAREDGSHIFSETLSQHNAAIASLD